jgi:hypothetical protein
MATSNAKAPPVTAQAAQHQRGSLTGSGHGPRPGMALGGRLAEGPYHRGGLDPRGAPRRAVCAAVAPPDLLAPRGRIGQAEPYQRDLAAGEHSVIPSKVACRRAGTAL